MRRRLRSRAGFTLAELIVASGLATIVMLGLSYLIVPLVRAEVLAAQSQTVQLNLAAALKTADLEISQASWLSEPSQPGRPSDRLEGCQNASAPAPGFPPAPLDPSRPMRWFALCPSGGRLYYHTGAGCPPDYACGTQAAAAFGGGSSPSTQSVFTRASALTTVVEIDLTMTTGRATANLQSAAAYAGAAGTGQ